MYKQRPVMSGVPQDLVLGPPLFYIFGGDMGSGVECTLSKFADDTKMCGVVNMLEARDVIQRDLERLERWACVKLVKFNKTKFKVLHMVWGNAMQKYSPCREGIETSLEKKDVRVFADKKLNMTCQCVLVAQKANRLLCCFQSSMVSRSMEVILPLYTALVRAHLESSVQLWSPQHRKDTDLLERGQKRATKMV